MMQLLSLFIILSLVSCVPSRITYQSSLPTHSKTLHLVKENDSLWRISKEYSVSIEEIMKENKFSSLSDLRVGQSIVIPNYHKRKEEIYFIWPVRGEIINSFGENVGHIINNGLNIKVKSDDSVLASAEGKTLYANYLKGWGKTIVLKHARDFYTVYANLNNIQVREGSDVKRGEVIGKISSAQGNNGYILHFEIRKSHIPQNPLQYLK